MDARKCYVSSQQKNKLIEIVTNDQNLISGKFSACFTYKDSQKKWEAITNILNAFPGANKTWKQWRKTWQDIRTKTKNKNTMIRKYSQGTGGGPSTSDALTDMDMKVLSTMTSQVLQGSDVPETEISFQFPEEVIEIEVTNDNDDEPLDNHYSSLNNISDLPSCSKDIMQTQVEENKSNTATKSSNFTTILADRSNNNSEFDGKPFLDHQYSVPENSNVAVQPCHGEKKKIHKEVVGGKKINKAFCNSNIVKTPKKRSVAAQRLLKSSDASTILANVSNKDLDIREKYYERKLNLMERLVVAIEKIASVQCQTVNCQ